MQFIPLIMSVLLRCFLRDMKPVKTHLCRFIDCDDIYWEANFTKMVLTMTLIVEKENFISLILYLVSEDKQVQAKSLVRSYILNIEPRPWFYHLASFLIFPIQFVIWAYNHITK